MEQWKDVESYEGLYEVSNYGNVRSLNYRRTGKTRLLKPRKDGNGYLFVNLFKDGKGKHKSVHRLVAEAFIPNPNHLPEVNHKDEDKTNNVCWNLEFCDRRYNNNYGTHNQRVADSQSTPIDQFTLDGVFVRRWKSIMEASRQLGISQGNISDCLRGRYKTTAGFKWKYPQKVETNI